VILLVDQFLPKDYLRIAHNQSVICFVSRDEIANISFPPGHPLSKTLYVGHPLRPTKYYLATEFHDRLFEEKFAEFCRLLRHLGAKYVELEYIAGNRPEYIQRYRTEAISGATRKPELPPDMVWYQYEHLWREVAEGRIIHHLRSLLLK
jgi:hypothetical protein